MPDNDTPISFPAFIMQAKFQPGSSRHHFVENALRDIWSSVDHAHVFRVEFDDETATWEAMWILAPAHYWEAFLESIHQESVEDVENMLEGVEALLAEQPEPEND
jgi:hypothetical protein